MLYLDLVVTPNGSQNPHVCVCVCHRPLTMFLYCVCAYVFVLCIQAVCNQPVAITIYVDSSFQSYGGGVFTGTSSCMSGTINHAILVVGFDTDSTTGQDYWIVKNQWGTGWGEQGYIRILRNQNVCEMVLLSPSFPTVAAGKSFLFKASRLCLELAVWFAVK